MRNIIAILLFISAIGCDPVRRVLDDPAHRVRVSDELLRDGLCRYDTLTVIKRDTTIRIDTIGEIVIFTDTIIKGDTVRFPSVVYKTITKYVTIRDTVRMAVVDASGRDAHIRQVSELEGRLKEVGDSARRYRTATGFLLIALVGLIALAVRK
jgi:hypothetical protein